ncbi:MAG TPA: ATP-binding protein [Dongiaceae bacterium]|jgi:signal transduction histidine kinase|nr:ATP-binding protein [Dongiaceae bacterium]
MAHRIAPTMNTGDVLELFAAGLDRGGIAYSLWDSEDRLVAYNDIYVTMFFTGLEHVVELGQTFERQNARWGEVKASVVQNSDMRDQVADRLRRHREPRTSFERKIDDRWIRTNEMRTADGGMISIHTDITREKERENAAREGERRFRSLVENLRGIVFCRGIKGDGPHGYDEAGCQVYGTETYRLFGAVDENGVSLLDDWYDSILPEDRDRYMRAEQARKEFDQPYDVEFRFIHHITGKLHWAREVAWVYRDEEHDRTFFDSYLIDITDVKNREAELSRSRADLTVAIKQADAASRAKSAFLASMSHELRTPLNAVIGFGQVISMEKVGAGVAPAYREYGKLIVDSGQHLLNLISDILDLSKVEAGKMEINESDFPVSEVITEVRRLLGDQIGNRLQMLAIDPAPAGLLLRADRRRILQILINLLGNASKYSPIGSTITLRCRVRRDGALELLVADEGPGMTDAEIEVALTLFGQAAAGRSHNSGTGLGLPLARTMTELHGGQMVIESVKGRGTTIHVALPPDRVLQPALQEPVHQLHLSLG